LLDLRGRDAEIQQDGLGDADVVGAGDTVEVAEVAPPEDGAGAEASQPGSRPRQRLGIAVDPEQPHLVRRPFQHRLGVSAHAHRSVDHPAPATGAQEEEHLVEQHRDVNRYTPRLDSLSNTDDSSS
jgi:hypothetical protein